MNNSAAIFLSSNDSLFNIITKLLNGTDLYKHQSADLIEVERFPLRGIHILIWTLCIITYLLAIPVATRIIRSKSYLNVSDYFSLHIVICAFVAWIPSLLSILHQRFESFVLRFCRLHYAILQTNQTVPLFFVLYMVIERFFYFYPSLKHKCKLLTTTIFIHLYAVFTWLLIMLIFAVLQPFNSVDSHSTIYEYTKHFCSYDYGRLHEIATGQSIIYFILFAPSLVLIGFVLRYFYLMRGTNQVPPEEKLRTIRVTSLLCVLVFYEIYLYYLEHVTQSFRALIIGSVLRSTFFLVQIMIIIWTERYWIEILFQCCDCLCAICLNKRRQTTTPVPMSIETEFTSFPYSASAGMYSLVDDQVIDEFDDVDDRPSSQQQQQQQTQQQPALRVLV